MKLNFFSSILILLLVTMSCKTIVLISKIQDETKYNFVTHANSSLIETAYAKDETENTPTAPNSAVVAANASAPVAQNSINTNLPNFENNLSKDEVQVLQDLSSRRQALDKEQENLNLRENVLKATENKLDQKVQELKALQEQVSELMKGYDAQENAKFHSLVKIYENMKPRDAAKIFDELEMPMLIQIVTRMKEVRVAPIIAAMNPSKAKELSIELAKQRSLD